MSDFPQTHIELARSLENLLVAACEGATSDNAFYQMVRSELMADTVLRPLLPEFVCTCRDLAHFWGYIKEVSPKWAPRRRHVREAMTPLFNYLEGTNRAPVDAAASDVLQKFDADGVHAVWEKALARRHTDPDGAITTARTLLETVCKRILDEAIETYSDKDDLPALYRAVAMRLQIAPSQHTEEAFKRILGGATSVVEGLDHSATRSATRTGKEAGPSAPLRDTRSSPSICRALWRPSWWTRGSSEASERAPRTIHCTTPTINEDGSISFGGENFNSPSVAAGVAITKITGLGRQAAPISPINGWNFWQLRSPGGVNRPLAEYRQAAEGK